MPSDYHGYRLVAMPLLPLHSILYGSNDGGHTVHRSNAEFNRLMERAAKKLHVAGHAVGRDRAVLHTAGYDGLTLFGRRVMC